MTDSDFTDPDPIPPDFGVAYIVKHIFWMTWRWVYFNPLTIVCGAQLELNDYATDHPSVKWVSRATSIMGIIIAQVRNRGRDYTVPIKSGK